MQFSYSKLHSILFIIRTVAILSLSSPRFNQLQYTRFKSDTRAPAQLRALTTLTRHIALRKASFFLENIPLHTFRPRFDLDNPAAKTGVFGLTLHESTHNGFLQIMHPRTFHIKNPSDAKLASLSILRKWPVSMATIVKNLKIQNVQYLNTYLSYFHNISFWTDVLE